VYGLLNAANLDDVARNLESLPAEIRASLKELSPATTLQNIRAPLIVFGHDQADLVIPVSESREMKEALAGRPGVHYTEFALFQHATPRRLPVVRLARELVRFYLYIYPIFRWAVSIEDAEPSAAR